MRLSRGSRTLGVESLSSQVVSLPSTASRLPDLAHRKVYVLPPCPDGRKWVMSSRKRPSLLAHSQV
ncbi:hypothetical protein CGRA01v4_08513 [Colletotrichum graminicola]|nr:hypothetical protein CGRA01v4_08513 [Colletotrichum graminicola]